MREKWNSPKGSVMGAESEVVRKLLDKKVYTHGELEKELDMKLEDMFAGNPSQLASIKAAHDKDVGGEFFTLAVALAQSAGWQIPWSPMPRSGADVRSHIKE